MIIGLTATRIGLSDFQKQELSQLLKSYNCSEFAHGDCIGGDSQGHDLAIGNNVSLISIFPGDNPRKRAWKDNPTKDHFKKWQWEEVNGHRTRWMPVDYNLNRNIHIVNHVKLLIACPKTEKYEQRSGTWHTIRYAQKIREKTDKRIIVIPPS